MNQYLEIPFQLPSLNDLIAANRRNRFSGAELKKKTDDAIQMVIKQQRLIPVSLPCIVHILFDEPNRRRDVDNVESASKYILDALVKTGILVNDSPKYVIGAPTFTRYGKKGRVLVTIIEDDNEDCLRRKLKTASETITREV